MLAPDRQWKDEADIRSSQEKIRATATKLAAVAQTYQILARLYRPPNESLRERDPVLELRGTASLLSSGGVRAALGEMDRQLAEMADVTELAKEYVRLFRGPAKALVYPYASMYLDGEIMGPSTMWAIDLYTQAGLQVSGDFKDLPDHVTTELEFTSYLYHAEAEHLSIGEAEEAARFADLRGRFIQEHLARWIPLFAQQIEKHTTAPFYRGLAAITDGRYNGSRRRPPTDLV